MALPRDGTDRISYRCTECDDSQKLYRLHDQCHYEANLYCSHCLLSGKGWETKDLNSTWLPAIPKSYKDFFEKEELNSSDSRQKWWYSQ